MKLSLLLAILMLALMGCGKDKSKSKPTEQAYNPYIGAIPATSQQAYANLLAWYNSTTENGYYSGAKYVERTTIVYKENNGCTTKTYWGFIDFTKCSNGVENQSVTFKGYVAMLSTGQSKSLNTKLASVFSPTAGSTLAGVNNSGNVYVVTWIKPNNQRVVYYIDTGLNSALNPYATEDSESRSLEKLTQVY